MIAWILAIVVGFALLLWSADRFVAGASTAARVLGMSPLLIGMLIVGFGTSSPEMIVSAMAALDGNSDLALGNAYGSNILNIALILGVTAVIQPIAVKSGILRSELPVLAFVTLVAGYQLIDSDISRLDAAVLLGLFLLLIGWSIDQARRNRSDALDAEMSRELDADTMTTRAAIIWLVVGLVLLVISARMLVWGAVGLASALGVSDLVIGLTIVAIGTSLPELASSIVAARRGEHDIAVGNIIGSNLFNTLAVVGLAGAISPTHVADGVLLRDWSFMFGLTLALFIVGYGFRGRRGRINRYEGGGLMLAYGIYVGWLLVAVS